MLEVAEKKCSECLFTKNRIVHKERAAQIIAECKERDMHFICHKGTLANRNVVCHGSYQQMPQNVRLAGRLGVIRMVDADALNED